MRRMGGLRKYMPITYWTTLIGSLALIAFPGMSGFFSKDAIIEAVGLSAIPGAGYAYLCLLIGVFVTALYSFRMFFLVFHGEERLDAELRGHVRESPLVITLPLVLLAVASIASGWPFIESVVFGGYFGDSIVVDPAHAVLGELGRDFHGPGAFVLHGLLGMPLLLAAAGVAVAWYAYMKEPSLPDRVRRKASVLYTLLANKYYLDDLNEKVIMRGTRGVGTLLWRVGDMFLIDGAVVNGSARVVDWFAGRMRRGQTGYLYHYAFAMVIGLSILLGWILFKRA